MIVMRCDASAELGLGHLIRCLELARELRRYDEVAFACELDPADHLIRDGGYPIIQKASGECEELFILRVASELAPRALVLDTKHPYSSSVVQRLKRVRPDSPIMTVILGNVCDGLRQCDLAVFPSAHEDEDLLKAYMAHGHLATPLLGIQYVIIRREVRKARERVQRRGAVTPRLVVTTGGSDPRGVMIRLIRLFEGFQMDGAVSLLTGSSFAHWDKLERLKPDLPNHVSIRPYSVEELVSATAVVCTFGMSMYEMIYLEVPTICVSHSQENARYAHILQERHPVFMDLGFIEDLEAGKLRKALDSVLSATTHRAGVTSAAASIVDGHGATRIATRIAELCG